MSLPGYSAKVVSTRFLLGPVSAFLLPCKGWVEGSSTWTKSTHHTKRGKLSRTPSRFQSQLLICNNLNESMKSWLYW